MSLSPLYRSTEPLSVRVRIAKSTVTCRMLIAYAVPGGFWPSRPWKMTCWSKMWSAIITPCGVQCKGNECRDLPMMSLVPALSCFRPSLRIYVRFTPTAKVTMEVKSPSNKHTCLDCFVVPVLCKHKRRVDADVVHLNKSR